MKFTKKNVIEAVAIPRIDFKDNPLDFVEFPDWLKAAFDNRFIAPRFIGGTYWEYHLFYLESPGQYVVGKPGSYIVQELDGSLTIKKLWEIEQEYNWVDETLPSLTPEGKTS